MALENDEWVSLREAIGSIVSSVCVQSSSRPTTATGEEIRPYRVNTMRFRSGAISIVQQAGKHIGG